MCVCPVSVLLARISVDMATDGPPTSVSRKLATNLAQLALRSLTKHTSRLPEIRTELPTQVRRLWQNLSHFTWQNPRSALPT